jgi:hypothetical protein
MGLSRLGGTGLESVRNGCPNLQGMAPTSPPAGVAAAPKTFQAPARSASRSIDRSIAARIPRTGPEPVSPPPARACWRTRLALCRAPCPPIPLSSSHPPLGTTVVALGQHRPPRAERRPSRAGSTDLRGNRRFTSRPLPCRHQGALATPLSRRSARTPTPREPTSVPPPEVSHACSRTHGSEARSAPRSVDTSRRSRLVLPYFHAGLLGPQVWPVSISYSFNSSSNVA